MGDKRRIGKQFHVIVPNKCDGGGVEVFWAFGVGEMGEGASQSFVMPIFVRRKTLFLGFFFTK